MLIRNVNINDINPYENNPRDHSKDQIKALSKSIKDFGWHGTILLDKNYVIIAGHARFEAAQKAGLKELPCEFVENFTEEQVAAYRVLDNKIAEMSKDNIGKLEIELKKIPDFDFKEYGLDIRPIQVKEFEGEDEIEDVEIKSETVTKEGDVWILGSHRLMCGNSTNPDNIDKLIRGNSIDIIHTDPPYGINENTDRLRSKRTKIAKAGVYDRIIGDEDTQTAIDAFNIVQSMNISIMIFWGANHYCHALPESANWLVWDKRVEENQRDVNSDCELAWVKSNAKSVRIFRHLWKGMIKASENGESRVHPTQKPVALAEWCFNEYCPESKNVLDLFGGSGSTLIACEKTNRKCFMMELSPYYCDIIIKRWQKLTNKSAILESNGKTFNELESEK